MLRSVGITKIRITLLYFYEALILVFASSIMGIAIGLLVGLVKDSRRYPLSLYHLGEKGYFSNQSALCGVLADIVKA